jgi:hypothetical protein
MKRRLLGGLAGFLILVPAVVALALPNLATAGFQYVAGSGLDAETLVRNRKRSSTQEK